MASISIAIAADTKAAVTSIDDLQEEFLNLKTEVMNLGDPDAIEAVGRLETAMEQAQADTQKAADTAQNLNTQLRNLKTPVQDASTVVESFGDKDGDGAMGKLKDGLAFNAAFAIPEMAEALGSGGLQGAVESAGSAISGMGMFLEPEFGIPIAIVGGLVTVLVANLGKLKDALKDLANGKAEIDVKADLTDAEKAMSNFSSSVTQKHIIQTIDATLDGLSGVLETIDKEITSPTFQAHFDADMDAATKDFGTFAKKASSEVIPITMKLGMDFAEDFDKWVLSVEKRVIEAPIEIAFNVNQGSLNAAINSIEYMIPGWMRSLLQDVYYGINPLAGIEAEARNLKNLGKAL